jgi:hypothetical protein
MGHECQNIDRLRPGCQAALPARQKSSKKRRHLHG